MYRLPFGHGSLLEIDGSIAVNLGNGARDSEFLKCWGFDEGEMWDFELEVPRVRGGR